MTAISCSERVVLDSNNQEDSNRKWHKTNQSREPSPVLARFDESFRQQEMVFATLNLFVLAALLLLHSLFSSLLGQPSPALLVTLGAAFLFKMLELLWLWAGVRTLSEALADIVVWTSISLNIVLALLLTFLTNREDSPYFVLLALPVLQAAYRFRLPTCIGVIVVADSMTFFWVWHFAEFHPPSPRQPSTLKPASFPLCMHSWDCWSGCSSTSFEVIKESWPIICENSSARVSD